MSESCVHRSFSRAIWTYLQDLKMLFAREFSESLGIEESYQFNEMILINCCSSAIFWITIYPQEWSFAHWIKSWIIEKLSSADASAEQISFSASRDHIPKSFQVPAKFCKYCGFSREPVQPRLIVIESKQLLSNFCSRTMMELCPKLCKESCISWLGLSLVHTYPTAE